MFVLIQAGGDNLITREPLDPLDQRGCLSAAVGYQFLRYNFEKVVD